MTGEWQRPDGCICPSTAGDGSDYYNPRDCPVHGVPPTHPVTAPADCTNPQPIPVTFASERHQVMCARCEYRSPIVADSRSARQGFDAEHGSAS